MTSPKSTKDKAEAILRDLVNIPNGAPTWIYQHPVRDPLGNVMAYVDGTQCLICYKAVRGRTAKHTKDCAWIRAKRLLASKRGKKVGKG